MTILILDSVNGSNMPPHMTPSGESVLFADVNQMSTEQVLKLSNNKY